MEVIASHSLESLAQELAHAIKHQEGNIFEPVYILTPNNGIDKWLKIKIAEENGICANVRFLSFSEFLEMLYYGLVPKNERKEKLSSMQFQWLIYGILSEDLFLQTHPVIRRYFETDTDIKAIKQYGLSGKIAQLFDSYSALIPERLTAWEEAINLDSITNEHEKWQAVIWRRLKQNDNFLIKDQDLFNEVKKSLTSSENIQKLKSIISRLYAFNYFDFTPAQLKIVKTLSQYFNVRCFFFSPLESNKNQESGNPLVRNWSLNHKILVDELETAGIPIEYLEGLHIEQKSVLGRLQYDLIHNCTTQANQADNIEPDDSILINSCFTIYREVEVLYNYIVRTINSNQDIGSRDVVVYCTDIQKYAPAIKAIFNSAPYEIPFHILDPSKKDLDSPLMALLALFEVDPDHLSPESIMHVLDYPSIQKKFGIGDTDFIRRLINKANIRHGYAGNKDNETNLVSWRYGLDKLLLSYYMPSPDEGYHSFKTEGYENDEYFLIDEIEGSGVFDMIRFRYFFESVYKTLIDTKKEKTLADWIDYIRNVIEFYIQTPNDNRLAILDKELARLAIVAESNRSPIPFPVFLKTLQTMFEKIRVDPSGKDQGVSFCSSLPNRSVPFKVIGFLGLNYDVFPRNETMLSFDLCKDLYLAQGRKKLEKDKFFFLESILSARKQIYFSYIGRNEKNGDKLPPSSILEELMDYLIHTYRLNVEYFPSIHPLYGFDATYNAQDNRFYNYISLTNEVIPVYEEDAENANEQNEISITVDENDANINLDSNSIATKKETTLDNFLSYFKDPFKYYFNHVLGIYYRDEDETLQEEEVFEIDELQKWQIKSGLVQNSITLEDHKDLKESGMLPLKNMGQAYLLEVNEKLWELKERLKEETDGYSVVEMNLNCELDSLKIKGLCKNIYTNGEKTKLVLYSISSKDKRDKLVALANYLIISNFSALSNLDFIYIDQNGNSFVINQEIFDRDISEQSFSLLKDLFYKAQNNISFFDFIAARDDEENGFNPYVKTLKVIGELYKPYVKDMIDKNNEAIEGQILNLLIK